MRSIASAARWAAYLLVAATMLVVIVACPEGPAGEPGQPGQPGQPGEPAKLPPIPVGSIDAVSVVAGQSADAMDVSAYFSEPEGQDLTYSVSTSDATVATAAVTGSSVTITGVGAGTARITVTATDTTALSISQVIAVTVTAVPVGPVAMMPCAAVPMLKKDETCEEAVAAGQALESGDTSIFSVTVKADTDGLIWTVKATGKGKTTLRVVDKATKQVVRIKQATVINTDPERSDKVLDTTVDLLEMTRHTSATPSFNYDAKKDTLYTIDMRGSFASYFKDKDGASDLAKYHITTDTPYVIVRGQHADNGMVLVDVANMAADSFQLSIVAEDKGMAMSPALTGMVRWQPAVGRTYVVEQFDSGNLRTEDIELRWGSGVTHTLRFAQVLPIVAPATATDEVALEFIADWTAPAASDWPGTEFPGDDFLVSTTKPTEATTDTSPADGIIDVSGGRYIEITATSPISVGAYTAVANGATGDARFPTLAFTLRGSGASEPATGTATITINYYAVYDADGIDDPATTDVVEGAAQERKVHLAASKTLMVNIIRVQ